MSTATEKNTPQQPNQGWFNRFLGVVEWLGNLLPHPITLFALFCVFIIIFSGIAEYFGMSVPDPRPEGAKGREADGVIEVISLFSADGLRRIVQNLVTNFTGFTPLGTVLVALLGVSVAEHSGMLSALMRSLVIGASKRMVTVMIVFAGVCAALLLAHDFSPFLTPPPTKVPHLKESDQSLPTPIPNTL